VTDDLADLDDELAGLSEFALLDDNARQAGVTGPLPQVQRVESSAGASQISALRWGVEAPRVVFLHGGAQNAHTWDTVIVGLGEPALAVDLPGHGRSAWRDDGDYGPRRNAATLEPVLRELAPNADLLVGMSPRRPDRGPAGRDGARTGASTGHRRRDTRSAGACCTIPGDCPTAPGPGATTRCAEPATSATFGTTSPR
jgi:hypothetical protein